MINIPRADDEHTAHTQKSVLGATSKTNKQYIIQIEVDPPPLYPFFDKFIFDAVLIMLTSFPPLEFLKKS